MNKREFFGKAALAACFLGTATLHADDTAGLAQRYQQGAALAQSGKPEEALAIFNGILHDSPNAPGSLYYAAFLEMRLGKQDAAFPYLEKLRSIAPDDPRAILLSLEAHQTLGQKDAVERDRARLYALHNGTKRIPGLSNLKAFPRERIAQAPLKIELNEFFDYRTDPHLVWEALAIDPSSKTPRHIVLIYDPVRTVELRRAHSADPKWATTEVFLFGEFIYQNGAVKEFDLYRQEADLPEYDTFRGWALQALAERPKPLFVQSLK